MRRNPRCLLLGTITALLAAPVAVAGAGSARTPSALARALADPSRAADRSADARRHPRELIALSGMKAGQRVLDLIPGNGYWSRVFSKIVGPRGRVYAVWPDAYAKLAQSNVATLRAISTTYPNVVTAVQPTTNLSAPEPLDIVWTSQNYHDYADPFMGSPGSDALARAVFRILKPGGVFMVIDHSSAAGRGLADTDKLHRIDPETVKRQAKAAGFEFAGESRVLINPADPLTIPVFDASIRGRTSQFAFKFRKPVR
jgi:predicted methyltransferase